MVIGTKVSKTENGWASHILSPEGYTLVPIAADPMYLADYDEPLSSTFMDEGICLPMMT